MRYAGTTIGYISTLPVSQAKRWTNEQPRIDIYIDSDNNCLRGSKFFRIRPCRIT
ncbi:DUF2686 family protein [Escherichia coli]